MPLKLTCPAGTSTYPATLLNKDEIGLCPKHYLPGGASQGLILLAPLPFFVEFTSNLQPGGGGGGGGISRKKGSFLRPPHVRDFVKEGYFLYPGTKYGGQNPLTIHEIYAALTPSDSRSDWAS